MSADRWLGLPWDPEVADHGWMPQTPPPVPPDDDAPQLDPAAEPSPEPGPEPGPIPDISPVRPVGLADPGSRRAAAVALTAALVLWAIVAGLQAMSAALASKAPAEVASSVSPPGPDPVTITSQIMVSLNERTGGDLTALGGRLSDLDRLATGPADRLRIAVVAAELDGPEAGVDRLGELDAELDALRPDANADERAVLDELAGDARTIRAILTTGDPALVGADERDGLIDRHGWFAKLALTMGDGVDAQTRAAVVDSGMRLLITLAGFGLLVIAAFLVGVVLMIVAIVKMSTGRVVWRFRRPAPGGSVYLESFAIFVGAFLILQVVMAWVETQTSKDAALRISLIAQWALVLCPLWPMVRGVSLARIREDLGLVRGRGIAREMLAGVVGYLAGLPLYVLVWVATLVVISIVQQGPGEGQANPVAEAIERGDTLTIVLVFVLATVWAPLVEESIFRGGVYRHLRSRFGLVLAALLVGVFFSFMHGYGLLMTPPLIMLAVTFSVMREWRGSLIAPITAHFLHNAVSLSVFLAVYSMTGS